MRVWRICRAEHAATAFSGEGARVFGGRWNHRGTPMVYTAESRALAALELLVHMHRGRLPPRCVCFAVDVPDELARQRLRTTDLPRRWHHHPAPPELQELGSRWVEAASSVCLQVPSAVVLGEHDYLLNPRHPEFPRLAIGPAEPFEFDERLGG